MYALIGGVELGSERKFFDHVQGGGRLRNDISMLLLCCEGREVFCMLTVPNPQNMQNMHNMAPRKYTVAICDFLAFDV